MTMDTSNTYLKKLLDAFLEETISRAELQELLELISQYQGNLQELLSETDLERFIQGTSQEQHLDTATSERIHHQLLTNIRQQDLIQPSHKIHRTRWMMSAAAILLLILAGIYFQAIHKTTPKNQELITSTRDVAPPSLNQAYIKLSDGTQIALSDLEKGAITDQGIVELEKNQHGQLIYKTIDQASKGKTGLHTVFNPKGSKLIQMRLSDGSLVWLNAGSSITYPVQFSDNQRVVAMEGEAFFEITTNPSKPFIVNNGTTAITVTGTQFNVNAYEDEEAVRISLLEGSVKINAANHTSLLKPGEQLSVGESSVTLTRQVDMDHVMAWKNGLFSFNQAGLRSIMRTIARWYNIEVVYEGQISDDKYEGQISMDTKLSEVLELLELNHIGYEIDNNIVKLKSTK